MFSKKQRKEAAPIAAKQNAVDSQKQVQRNFSMDHKLFKKFWQLVSCRKYQGKGYGEEVEAYMPPSQTFLDDEQQYNLWKELATTKGCSHTIVAQRAEYKKKLFEAFPAEFYWAQIDFSKMTKNMKRKGFDVHKLPTLEQTQQLGMLGGHRVSSSARVSIKHGMEAVEEDSRKPPAMVGKKPVGQDGEEP
jgi:uncharacterized protein with NAD-binding domain and iron-sulfur cluster